MTSIRLKIEESWYASMDCKVQKSGPWVCFYGGHSTGYKLGNHPKNIEPCAHRARTVRAPCAHRATTPPKTQRHMRRLHEYKNVCQRYTQQILGHALNWAQRRSIEACADQAMRDLYGTETLRLQRQLYLHRKRPRENGIPPCGRSHYYHCQKDTKHTGTPTNGRSHAT